MMRSTLVAVLAGLLAGAHGESAEGRDGCRGVSG